MLLQLQRYETLPATDYWIYNEYFQINQAEGITFSSIMVLAAIAVGLGKHYYNNAQKLTKQNSVLLAENAVHEVEVLKEKLQPHAFKNTLAHIKASLSGLNKSVNSLSSMLEYMLYGTNSHWVCPKDEIAFLEDLLHFHAVRLEQVIVKPEKNVDESNAYYDIPCLPHLVTTYFIENALKHGDTKADDFLEVKVSLRGKEFYFYVKNRMKRQNIQHSQTTNGGVGLVNLAKRMDLLTTRHDVKNRIVDGFYIAELKIEFDG